MNRLFLGVILLAFLIVVSTGHPDVHAAAARTIYVDGKWPGPWEGTVQDPYQNISSGISYASDGDTVFVYNGTYYEQLNVNKTITLQGQDSQLTIIDANQSGAVVTVEANNVTITGFTLQNSGENFSGVSILDSAGSKVHDNIVESDYEGIYLFNSSGNTLTDNEILDNYYGISLDSSYADNITQNTVSSNNDTGIRLSNSSNIAVADNNIARNTFGIALITSDNNTLTDNGISLGTDGLYILDSDHNIFSNNRASSNIDSGIRLTQSTDNVVDNNTFSNDLSGILLENSTANLLSTNELLMNTQFGLQTLYSYNNTVSGNSFSDNVVRSILLYYSNNNTIFHNNFDDDNRTIASVNSMNNLDNGQEGNYWIDYGGTDKNRDGIGDRPYIVDVNNQDNFPLMGAFTSFSIASELGIESVSIISNSTISQFQFNETIKMLTFSVTNSNNTGFCRIDIPEELSGGPYTALADDKQVNATGLSISNSSNTFLYFIFDPSTQQIKILPTSYYELLNAYSTLLENYENLNATFYQMTMTYTNQYQSLQRLYGTLNQTYQATLSNYTQLSNNFNELNRTYEEALGNYNAILSQFELLNLTLSKTQLDYANTQLALWTISIAALASIIITSSFAVKYGRKSRRQEVLAEKYRSELERTSLLHVARTQFEADVQRRKEKMEEFQTKYGIEVRPRNTLEDVIKNLELKKKIDD
jgi:parallel beta-helix repeat protein